MYVKMKVTETGKPQSEVGLECRNPPGRTFSVGGHPKAHVSRGEKNPAEEQEKTNKGDPRAAGQ